MIFTPMVRSDETFNQSATRTSFVLVYFVPWYTTASRPPKIIYQQHFLTQMTQQQHEDIAAMTMRKMAQAASPSPPHIRHSRSSSSHHDPSLHSQLPRIPTVLPPNQPLDGTTVSSRSSHSKSGSSHAQSSCR